MVEVNSEYIENKKVEVTIQPLSAEKKVTTVIQDGLELLSSGILKDNCLDNSHPHFDTALPVSTDKTSVENRKNDEKKVAAVLQDGNVQIKDENYTSSLELSGIPEIPPEYEISRPRPQIMTVFGPMPLPPEVCKKIPEKFVAKPILEEREIYVAKKEVQERIIEVPHIQFDHNFSNISKSLTVDKFVPNIREIVKEIPRKVYKPVIKERIIEIPQGVKYVEVPLEVPCKYPPKIVPKPVTQLVERVIETVKPVLKAEITELPQTVVKQIPKIRTIEIPYYVPCYKEKVVEIPYRPPACAQLSVNDANSIPPFQLPEELPVASSDRSAVFQNVQNVPFNIGPMILENLNEIKLPYEAKIEVKVTQPQFMNSNKKNVERNTNLSVKTSQMKDLSFSSIKNKFVNTAESMPLYPIESSDGIISAQPSSFSGELRSPYFSYENKIPTFGTENYKNTSSFSGAENRFSSNGLQSQFDASLLDKLDLSSMIPLMITCPPEVGNVKFAGLLTDPDILTKTGVVTLQEFKKNGNAENLFPPLPMHDNIPMKHQSAQIQKFNNHTLDNIAENSYSLDKLQDTLMQKIDKSYPSIQQSEKKNNWNFLNMFSKKCSNFCEKNCAQLCETRCFNN